MKKTFLAVLALVPLLAVGQGVTVSKKPGETMLTSRVIVGAISASVLNSTTLATGRTFTVTRVAWRLFNNSGGGAGTSVYRLSDGTNNCDCSEPCANTSSGAQKPIQTLCTGACTFAGGSNITFSVSSTTCTTTQPSIIGADVWGYWN